MDKTRIRYFLIWGMVIWWTVSLAAGCGTPEPRRSTSTPEVAPVSPLPTPTSAAVLEPTSAATPTSGVTSEPQREAIRLVVLHTNDNWGETAPCG